MLSKASRTQLVKPVIQGMVVYKMLIYRWPKNQLHKMDIHVKNFVWNGDIHTTSLTAVQMQRTCKPTREGGIGIQSLRGSIEGRKH